MTGVGPFSAFGQTIAGSDQLRELIRRKELELRRIPDESVRGPRGQQMSFREAEERHEFLKNKIDADEVGGSLRHRIVGTPTKVVTLIFLALIDFPVMLWLVSSVFNVDWTRPAGLRLVISVVLSFLGTAGAAWVLFHMGHIRRESKNARRELDWPNLSRSTKVSLFGVAALVVLISVVMFVRVFTEGVLSGLSGLALLLAVLVALIMLLSAALVFLTAFRDGSPEQEDLAHYSAVIQQGRRRQWRLEDEIERLRHEREMLEGRTRRGGGGVEPEVPGSAQQPAATRLAQEAAGPDIAADDAQVTRIDEVRRPRPPRYTTPAAAGPSVQDRPVS